MPGNSPIRYVPHDEIDKSKWDKCIDEATNSLIYGYSFYLDHMAKHWDALVLDDYDAVMPLTWNKKFGIFYLYQPAFTPELGVFGKDLTEDVIKNFIDSIPAKYKLIEISLNHQNNVVSTPSFISRTNYLLSLNKNYEELLKGYRENHQRNIQKAVQAGCVSKKNIDVHEIISLNKRQMSKTGAITDHDYKKFKELYLFLLNRQEATTYGIVNSKNNLLASAVFFFSHARTYYIMVGNHPDSRTAGASHALINTFIKDHAGEDILLDFEGSDIESLARFYSGFGATKETYAAIRWNRLPWWVKWAKR